MTPQQIKSRIQKRFPEDVNGIEYDGLHRSAKSALKKRIESGDWFGKFFHSFLTILDFCGMKVVDKNCGSCDGEKNLNGDEG